MATWRDDGADVLDADGRVVGYSFLQMRLSAHPDKPVVTHEHTWLRASLECILPLTTAISIGRC